MSKAIDFIALRLAVFVLTLIWLLYLTDFLTAFIISGGLLCLFCFLTARQKDKTAEKVKLPDLIFHLQLQGGEYLISLLTGGESDKKYFIEKQEMTYANFKFGKTVADDIAVIYRLAIKNDVKSVKLYAGEIDRNALLLASGLPLEINYIKPKELLKILNNRGIMPALIKRKKANPRVRAEAVYKTAFSAQATVYYLFSGLMTALLSFITPLKIYYLIMSSISLILAIISAFVRKKI